MGLFKEVYCDECGKKTKLLSRTKLQDGHCLCGNCGNKIPVIAYASLLRSYTLEMYRAFLDYIEYSNQYLRPHFTETHHYYTIHVDAEHKLFYIGRSISDNTVFFHFRNVQDFDLVFDVKEFKEGLISDKVTGQVLMELEMDAPSFHYEDVLDKNTTAKAEKALFGSKVRYGTPKGMSEFLEVFCALWKEAILEKYEEDGYDDDYTENTDPHTDTSKSSALHEAMALFMFDDLSAVTADILKQQRNRLMKVFHSDVSGADTTKYAQRINEAYEVLKQHLSER